MTEPEPDEAEVFITKEIRVFEYIDTDGRRVCDWAIEGDPTQWDVLGLLAAAEIDIRENWFSYIEADDE